LHALRKKDTPKIIAPRREIGIMSVSRRRLRIAFVIGIVMAVVAAPVVGQVLSGLIATSGTIPMQTNSGVTVNVAGASDMAGSDFPYDNTVDVNTDQGNITVSGNDPANVSIAASDITGDFTNTTNLDVANTTTLNPEDKEKITVEGQTTELAWSDYAPDDGSTDVVISGPDGTSSTVYLYNLPASTTISLVNKSTGATVAVADTNSNGRASFDIDHSTQNLVLQENDQSAIPEQSNPSPTGNLDTEPSQLSIDVDDDDFPSDNVTVTIDLDGSQIHQETITSASTVAASIPSSGKTGGSHSWTVNTTDKYGNERIEQYNYAVPDTLYIRNETNAFELVDDPVNVSITAIGSDDQTIVEKTTDTGTVDLTGLPISQPIVVELKPSQNYTDRVIYFREGEIYEQQDAYLLNTTYTTIESRFVLNDPTGSFDEQSVLYVSKAINQSGTLAFRTIHADKFGVEGVTVTLQSDERYRVKVVAQDGTAQDLGPYRSDASETVEVSPSAPGVEYDVQNKNWGYGATLDNRTLSWSYYDNTNETDSLTIYIHERNNESNQLVANETYLNLGNASGQYILTENESEKTWTVNFIVDRGGEEKTYAEHVYNQLSLFGNMDDGWKNVFAAGILILFAGSLSVLNVGVGAVVFGIASGILWFIGMLSGVTTGAAVVIYLFVALGLYIYKGGRP
jgi:hypothetical protein